MNTLRFILSAAAALLLAASVQAKEEVLLDFTRVTRDSPNGPIMKCYQYTFGDWGGGKVIDLKGRGALVQAPGGKGGLGENKTMLQLHKTPTIEIVYLIGNANQTGALNFSLTDRDGTEQSWQIPITGLAKGVEQRLRLDLTKPGSEQKPGKTPGLDLKKLETWQIRGDWGGAKVEVLLIKVTAPKP